MMSQMNYEIWNIKHETEGTSNMSLEEHKCFYVLKRKGVKLLIEQRRILERRKWKEEEKPIFSGTRFFNSHSRSI